MALIGVGLLLMQSGVGDEADGPLSVAEVINNSTRYADRIVRVRGLLNASFEFKSLSGDGCQTRLNLVKKPYACAIHLKFPDCSGAACEPWRTKIDDAIERLLLRRKRLDIVVELTGKLAIAPKIFMKYPFPPVVQGLPEGEYVEKGFGHRGAYPVELTITNGRVISESVPAANRP